MFYLSIKSLHIIAMVTWFAGLFYLPRLFVYHAQTNDRIGIERFKVMERKLFWVITTPGGIITVLSGILLLYLMPSWLKQPWMHVKLTFVFLLMIYHVTCWRYLTQFAQDINRHSSLFFRWFNELPTIALIVIVVSVVVKY
jgi:putative membrane protein